MIYFQYQYTIFILFMGYTVKTILLNLYLSY